MIETMDPSEFNIVKNLGLVENGLGSISRKRSQPLRRKVCRVGRWRPPLGDILKINTDGSSRGNPGQASVGGVGRDTNGNVIFMFSIHKGVHSNNVMMQACSLGWRKIVCELDSQIVVDMINN